MSDRSAQDRINAAIGRLRTDGAQMQRQEYAAPARRFREEARVQTASSVAQKTETAIDISKNPVFKIMAQTDVSDEKKIAQVVAYLTVHDEDFKTAREHFAEFEAYLHHEQSQGVEVNVQGIERLIDEIKAGLKPEVEKIVRSLVSVQQGINDAEKLLQVMKEARIQGKTVEQISAAVALNDQLIAAIAQMEETLKSLQGEQSVDEEHLNAQLDRKLASEKGFVNGFMRLFGPDKEIASAITRAQAQLEETKRQVLEHQNELTAKQGERNENLESGPLTILRTMDVTERNFSDNLVGTAENALDLIHGATRSIEILITRTANSEADARVILGKLAEADKRETLLRGAIQQVADGTRVQGQTIKARLDAKDEEISKLTESDVQMALRKSERVDVEQSLTGARDYEELLNKTVISLDSISASSAKAKSQADQLHSLIRSEKDLLKRLGLEALPETANALQIVLQTNFAQQTGELASTISRLTDEARRTGQESLGKLVEAEGELHNQQIADMEKAIGALEGARDIIVTRIERTVDEGIAVRERSKGLRGAAEELTNVVSQLEEIRPTVVARDHEEGLDGPSRPEDAGSSYQGEEPKVA